MDSNINQRMKRLEIAFLSDCQRISKGAESLSSKQEQIRIDRWLEKLKSPVYVLEFMRIRNQYSKYLVRCVESGTLTGTMFAHLPTDGPLRKLDKSECYVAASASVKQHTTGTGTSTTNLDLNVDVDGETGETEIETTEAETVQPNGGTDEANGTDGADGRAVQQSKQKRAATANITDLRSKVSALRAKLKIETSEKEKMAKEVSSLRATLRKREADLKRRNIALKENDEQLSEITAELKSIKEEKRAIDRIVADVNETADHLRDKLTEMAAKYSAAMSREANLKRIIAQQRIAVQKLESEKEQLMVNLNLSREHEYEGNQGEGDINVGGEGVAETKEEAVETVEEEEDLEKEDDEHEEKGEEVEEEKERQADAIQINIRTPAAPAAPTAPPPMTVQVTESEEKDAVDEPEMRQIGIVAPVPLMPGSGHSTQSENGGVRPRPISPSPFDIETMNIDDEDAMDTEHLLVIIDDLVRTEELFLQYVKRVDNENAQEIERECSAFYSNVCRVIDPDNGEEDVVRISDALQLFIELILSSLTPFEDYVDALESDGSGVVNVNEFLLIQPVLRIAKYSSIAEELAALGRLGEWKHLTEAAMKSQQLLRRVSRLAVHKAAQHKLRALKGRITGMPDSFSSSLVLPHRLLVRDGVMIGEDVDQGEGEGDGEDVLQLHFFLFNDLLLYCESRGGGETYRFRGCLELKDTNVTSVDDENLVISLSSSNEDQEAISNSISIRWAVTEENIVEYQEWKRILLEDLMM